MPGHRCGKKGHIQRMEEDDEEERVRKRGKCDKSNEEETEGEEYAVIATMTQPSKNRVLRIRCTLNGQKVIALVDSGASHNYINERLVSKMKFKTEKFKFFTIVQATGSLVHCTKVIPQQEITLGRKHTIKEDLHVVPLDLDIILGGQWIFSLGCFRFDFPNLKIHFEHKGEEITLEGIPDDLVKLVSCKRIKRIL